MLPGTSTCVFNEHELKVSTTSSTYAPFLRSSQFYMVSKSLTKDNINNWSQPLPLYFLSLNYSPVLQLKAGSFCPATFFFFLVCVCMLEIEPRALLMVGKHCTELQPSSHPQFFGGMIVVVLGFELAPLCLAFFYWDGDGLVNFLPGLTWNHGPPCFTILMSKNCPPLSYP
jgi:hypothetical protein